MIYDTKFFILLMVLSCLGLLMGCGKPESLTNNKLNVVIIFLDDSGWSDFEPFGQKEIQTPQVNRLAKEGVVYRNFYVPQAICSASRAALLTGSYPGRTKVFNAHAPKERGLSPNFPTMAEIYSADGYKTGIFGKWHLGDQENTRPHQRGFDVSSGLMYSNDMWEYHPENPEFWGKFPLQYWKNGQVEIEAVSRADQRNLTKWATDDAVNFINDYATQPFFLYVPYSMPHVPLFCSEAFEGKSGVGLYGDVIVELDASIGRIMDALSAAGIDEETLVVFTSDNGPWISYGNHSGTTPFREAKGTSFDGGTKVACIIKYPDNLAQGSVSDQVFLSIDLLPTIAHLTETPLPQQSIDGKNIWGLMTRETQMSPHDYYAFTIGPRLESVMSGSGRWKLHLPHNYRTRPSPGSDGMPGKYEQASIDLTLYDLANDPMETQDVKEGYPEVFKKMLGYAQKHKTKFELE